MSTEVEDLISEQKTANLNLKMLTDDTEIYDAILVESEKTNSLLEDNSKALVVMSSAIIPSSSNIVNQTIEPEVLPALGNPVDILMDIESNTDKALLFLDRISDGISSLVVNADTADLEQAGGVIDRQKGADPSSSIGDLFGGINMESLLGPSLTGFVVSIGKFMLGALKFIGPLAIAASVAAFAKGAFDVLSDDKRLKEVTGKARDDLNSAETAFAAFAGGLQTLSFGFFDAKDTFDVLKPFVPKMEQLILTISNVFSDFTDGIFKLLDGDVFGGAKDILIAFKTLPFKLIGGITEFVRDTIISGIELFAPDDMVAPLVKGVTEGFDPVIKLFKEDIPDIIKSFWNSAANIIETTVNSAISLFSLDIGITEFVDNIWGSVKDNFGAFFNQFTKSLESIFTSFLTPEEMAFVFDLFDNVVDTVKETINNMISNIKSTFNNIVDSVTGFFSKIESALNGVRSTIQTFLNDKIVSVIDLLPPFLKTDSMKELANSLRKEEPSQLKPEPKGISNSILRQESGINIPSSKSPSTGVDRTSRLSKERFDEKTINVNVTAPPATVIQKEAPREKRTIVRKKTHDDLSLAMAGLGG